VVRLEEMAAPEASVAPAVPAGKAEIEEATHSVAVLSLLAMAGRVAKAALAVPVALGATAELEGRSSIRQLWWTS